jgi:Protein of unknown function (DUF1573)
MRIYVSRIRREAVPLERSWLWRVIGTNRKDAARSIRALCVVLSMIMLGCSRQASLTDREIGSVSTINSEPVGSAPQSTALAEHKFDFGPILARGQTLQHQFVLRNTTRRPVRLLKAMALTPCCSSITSLPESIPPFGETKVAVEFKAGHETGQKRVRFVIETDSRLQPVRLFDLSAQLFSEYQISEIGGGGGILSVGHPGKQVFRIICRRFHAECRDAQESVEASAPLSAHFLGEAPERFERDGLIEIVRDIEVAIPASFEPGTHQATMLIRWAEGRDQSHFITWEVRPRIRATPSGIVIRTGTESVPPLVVLSSEDRAFRIVDVSCPLLADSIRPPEGSSRIHSLRLPLDAGRAAQAGTFDIQIETDEPDQQHVLVSVLVLPQGKE